MELELHFPHPMYLIVGYMHVWSLFFKLRKFCVNLLINNKQIAQLIDEKSDELLQQNQESNT
jgi:hypothetical protein